MFHSQDYLAKREKRAYSVAQNLDFVPFSASESCFKSGIFREPREKDVTIRNCGYCIWTDFCRVRSFPSLDFLLFGKQSVWRRVIPFRPTNTIKLAHTWTRARMVASWSKLVVTFGLIWSCLKFNFYTDLTDKWRKVFDLDCRFWTGEVCGTNCIQVI